LGRLIHWMTATGEPELLSRDIERQQAAPAAALA
jgi:hypothetical protein